jgi:hypothetical protein
MAHTTITVRIRRRWWVTSMLAAGRAFVFVMSPFLDSDDVDTLCENLAGFICRHGIRVEVD